MRKWLICVAFVGCVSTAFGEDKVVTQASFGTGSWPPFGFRAKDSDKEKLNGILPGILSTAVRKFGYTHRTKYFGEETTSVAMRKIMSEEKEQIICEGPASESWIPDDAKAGLIFSNTILKSRDLLFKAAKSKVVIKAESDLSGKKIGGCDGYRYPTLEKIQGITMVPSKGEGKSGCEEVGARLVLAGKADAVIINEHVFGYLLKNGVFKKGDFAKTGYVVEEFDLKIFCSKNANTEAFMPKLSATIEQMHKNGTIKSIVAKHAIVTDD